MVFELAESDSSVQIGIFRRSFDLSLRFVCSVSHFGRCSQARRLQRGLQGNRRGRARLSSRGQAH